MKSVRELLYQKGIDPCIPNREGAYLRKGEIFDSRNRDVLAIRGLGNDKEALSIWKKLRNYHQRSLVETTFSRLKGLLWR